MKQRLGIAKAMLNDPRKMCIRDRDKVRSTGMGGISADDDRAVEKLEAKLAGLEAMQEEMLSLIHIYPVCGSVPEGGNL